MTKDEKVPISERALLQRLNRALAKEDLMVKKSRSKDQDSRGNYVYRELGEFFVVNTQRNVVDSKNIDLEDWGKKMKVLKPWERLEVSDG
jgi:hypothetical protein